MASGKKLTKSQLREDQFLDWLVEAAEYVRHSARYFIAGAAGILAVIIIAVLITNAQERARLEAAVQLGEIWLAEEEGRPDDVIRLTAELTQEYDGTAAAGQGVLILANRYFHQGRYLEAEALYESYLNEYNALDVLVFAAWRGLAACLEARGQVEQAAAKYAEYAALHPGTIPASLALFEAARCYSEIGDFDNQRTALNQILTSYARSPVAGKAREELNML